MARKSTPPNGHTSLEEAIALLINNQAAFVGRLSENEQQRLENERRRLEFERQHLEFERQYQQYQRETAERFARIEAQMAEIIRVLNEHGRILESLTEAVREKIGFKGQP